IPSPSLPLPSPPLPLPTPPSPLLLPTTNRREDIPAADLPPRKRLCLTAPTPRFEIGESSTAAAARQAERPMSREARHAREAWLQDMNCNKAVHAELLAYRAQVQTHETHIQTQDAPLETRELARTNDPEDDDSKHEANRSRNRDDNHDSGTGSNRTERATHECTYIDFLKRQPFNFKGIEGVVGLNEWFERMESVFDISNCTVGNQINFSTCTLLGNALTWWNSHVKAVGHNVAYGMTWKTLMKMMTDKYRPRGEIKKLEIEMRMFPEESDQVEKYVGGLPDMIRGSVMASKPKTMQEEIDIANDLMDQKVRTFADRQAKNKRKLDDNTRNNQNHSKGKMWQGPTLLGLGRRKCTGGSKPLCPKCYYHHDWQYAPRAPEANQRVVTCFECGVQGHYKKDFPKLKNNNCDNQAGNVGATTRAYAVGNAGKNSDA
ncbi:hypothetical protein Tco_1460115, partial [Tanacetum coccineum]